MKNAYFLVKFWVLTKVAHMKLRKVKVGVINGRQENLKNLLSRIIDRMYDFLLVTSPKSRKSKVCRKLSEEIMDISISLRSTYLIPAWDDLVYNAVDLKNLTCRVE